MHILHTLHTLHAYMAEYICQSYSTAQFQMCVYFELHDGLYVQFKPSISSVDALYRKYNIYRHSTTHSHTQTHNTFKKHTHRTLPHIQPPTHTHTHTSLQRDISHSQRYWFSVLQIETCRKSCRESQVVSVSKDIGELEEEKKSWDNPFRTGQTKLERLSGETAASP